MQSTSAVGRAAKTSALEQMERNEKLILGLKPTTLTDIRQMYVVFRCILQ